MPLLLLRQRYGVYIMHAFLSLSARLSIHHRHRMINANDWLSVASVATYSATAAMQCHDHISIVFLCCVVSCLTLHTKRAARSFPECGTSLGASVYSPQLDFKYMQT
eukprot:gnl/TRDRNA2_/TRDRNA2_35256_c0_seq1.p1 gnl/TRDRNA2_/TRDRNA2_35256_c0~~gnl/TRDRNA2_/TRDRNA2_35256_c0_seq1.p1  ORF type:complete len:107 (-),score=0.38 gnl/TRDRNA2_/TRDRNA2_35256_c0_seq1:143-463(-)